MQINCGDKEEQTKLVWGQSRVWTTCLKMNLLARYLPNCWYMPRAAVYYDHAVTVSATVLSSSDE
jgi:hypothetical protein